MKTLALAEAAAFLHMHPEELRRRAKAGLIPGAKFVEVPGVHRSAAVDRPPLAFERVVEAPREGPALDQELGVETGRERGFQHPHDEFGLTNGQAPHRAVSVLEMSER